VVAGEGGFKYFLLGSIGSIFFLFGISVFYGFFGTLNFFEIFDLFLCEVSVGSVELGLKISFVFLVSFVFFKLMIIPFHSWGPDVYDGTFTFIVLFLATVPKVVFLLLFLKFYFLFFSFSIG